MPLTLVTRLDPWLPPLVLMAVIFALSAQPNLTIGLGPLEFATRKLAHASVYALLFLLWWRAFRRTGLAARATLLAMALTVAYAATDEWHQTFVPGRTGSPLAVAIDAAGAGTAALVAGRRA